VPDGPRAAVVAALVTGFLVALWFVPRRLPTGAGAVRWLALLALPMAEFVVPAAVLPEAAAGATVVVAVLALALLTLIHLNHATDRIALALRGVRLAPGRRRLD